MKTIFSNKAQKVEKSKLNDFRQGALLPTSELQLRTAMACSSNVLQQQMSCSTVEERKFSSQVTNRVFSLFLLPALHLKDNQSPHQSPQQATKRTPAPQEILCVACSLMKCLAFYRTVLSYT